MNIGDILSLIEKKDYSTVEEKVDLYLGKIRLHNAFLRKVRIHNACSKKLDLENVLMKTYSYDYRLIVIAAFIKIRMSNACYNCYTSQNPQLLVQAKQKQALALKYYRLAEKMRSNFPENVIREVESVYNEFPKWAPERNR